MSKTGHSNDAFVTDDGKCFNQSNESKQRHFTTIELSDSKKKSTNEKDDYDPYVSREVEHPTSNTDTLIHLLKGSLGTGILAMPNAFHHSGFVVGSIGTVIIGIICTYCIHMLLRSAYELCKRKRVPSLTYPAILQAALQDGPVWCRWLAPHIVHITNGFLIVYQLGACCIYVVFVATNMKDLVDYFSGVETDVRLFMLIILLPLVLINYIRNLKYLAPFSTIANIATIISFGIIWYYIFRDPLNLKDTRAVGNLREFPLFFGTVLFALEAIGVIMPLENEMKTPKSFGGSTGVLNRSMFVIVILYVGMGLFGYLKYGSKSAGSITLNLPTKELLAQLAKGVMAFGIFVSHGLACYVAIDITWNDYIKHKLGVDSKTIVWEFAVRTVLVLATFMLAVAIPNLELFISLFGALCLSALGLAFPALIEYCTFAKQTTGWRKIILIFKNVVIALIGAAGLIIGTYTSLEEIVRKIIVGDISDVSKP